MTPNEWAMPRFSNDAVAILGHLKRHGGTMRIGPLFWQTGRDGRRFILALKELHERRWVHVRWCRPRAVLLPGLPEGTREIERITLSRFGRRWYAVTWPTLP